MITIIATVPLGAPPTWAFLERQLITTLEQSIELFLQKYTHPDGSLIWRDGDIWTGHDGEWATRDGADDFYESFYNWPLLYILGGHERILTIALREWDAITIQLMRFGLVDPQTEYEVGSDQFHQSEGYLFFYFLCLADPTNPLLRKQAVRFAELFADPATQNYDDERTLIRAPYNGSGGPRWGVIDGEPVYLWRSYMRPYGLPYADVPGLTTYDDLHDPAKAQAMGVAMQERMGRGDVAANLLVTSLITNAALLTGDAKYTMWVQAYVSAWMRRAEANGGLLPDNVGLSGVVGEYLHGKWYGGLYGWTWPHGFYNLGATAFVAAANAFVLTRDAHFLDLPRDQLRALMEHGVTQASDATEMTLRHHWEGILAALEPPRMAWLIPYRYGDSGWFDYQPLPPSYLIGMWALSMAREDAQSIQDLRDQSQFDWQRVIAMRTKEDGGHEAPWFTFLHGENPRYPETILTQAYEVAAWRMAQIREDHADLSTVNIHHWQLHNPVTTEALVQLTLGAPQHTYNGGLLHCRLRYFDVERRRPGLPPEVAALITRLEPELTTVHLVNLGLVPRSLIIQSGGFAEHRFQQVRFTQLSSAYPGPSDEATNVPAAVDDMPYLADYSTRAYNESTRVPEVTTRWQEQPCAGPYLQVDLPPTSQIILEMGMELHVATPTYATPWSAAGGD